MVGDQLCVLMPQRVVVGYFAIDFSPKYWEEWKMTLNKEAFLQGFRIQIVLH